MDYWDSGAMAYDSESCWNWGRLKQAMMLEAVVVIASMTWSLLEVQMMVMMMDREDVDVAEELWCGEPVARRYGS